MSIKEKKLIIKDTVQGLSCNFRIVLEFNVRIKICSRDKQIFIK